jgi:GT2 family glycosyltransferase
MHLMDVQVPAVVAVVVTTGQGPWFDEALASLAAQDYEDLSILILATGDGPDPSPRVGRLLPEAYVRALPGNPGYAAAANEALSMVEGAAFFLLCHDDCALDPDAVHKLVEESFRSNAGVVSPKFVNWDDPSILLHVGMSCDKTGAVVDRIQDGEVDHGQHDAVRDIFVAPGGCILIRADLWRELGGFDAGIVAMGEDLDLSWRSQVAGSRVVVAPEARVRHREVVASGLEPISVVIGDDSDRPPTMQDLQRRHELRTILKCYGWFHLLRVLPQAALLAVGEIVVALIARDRPRARAVAGAWRWNLRHLGDLRQLRHQLNAHRLFPDSEVRRLQLRGSARLSRYFSRLTHQGFDAANAVVSLQGDHGDDDERHEIALLTGSVGLAFSEDSDFDELDDLGHRSGRDRFGRQVRRPFLSTGRQRVVAVIVASLVVLIGSRELFFGTFPLLGQLAPLPSWSASWHHFFSGWQSAGVGTTAPASPAFGLVGLVGTVFLGAMGTAQRVLVLGCIPLGAVGMWRFMRPLVSPRAAVVATICFLGLPLPYAALGTGRWDGLVTYAAFPFIVAKLARVSGLAPFDEVPAVGWRGSSLGQIALLGAIVGVASSFAPAVLPMTFVLALALIVGSVLVGAGDHVRHVITATLKTTVVALLLCAPWVVGILLSGSRSVDIFGLPISGAAAPSWGEVVRFAIGPAARSPFVWLMVGASALPLVLGTGVRLTWAARLWVLACASWVLAFVTTHGWTGTFAPSESVVLVPAAVAVAAGVGLGISSFENDLAGRAFGWRQIVSVAALAAVAIGLLPVAAGALNGRWDVATNGVEQPLAFLNRVSVSSEYRVLWIGDPRALPVGGWTIENGLSYALTEGGLPNATEVWTPSGPGPAQTAATALRLAIAGETVHLGRLLAPVGVAYVVVVDGLPTSESSAPASVTAPPPPALARALLNQNDLEIVPGEFGVQVYKNDSVIPVTAQRSVPSTLPPVHVSRPTELDVEGWLPILSPLTAKHPGVGPVGNGTAYVSYAPSSHFTLTIDHHAAARRDAFVWASSYPNAPKGRATLTFTGPPYVPVAVLVELLAWVMLAAALLGWRRWPLGRLKKYAPEEDPV